MVVSNWLGHSSVELTRSRYLAFCREFEEDMIGRLDMGKGPAEDLPNWSGKRAGGGVV